MEALAAPPAQGQPEIFNTAGAMTERRGIAVLTIGSTSIVALVRAPAGDAPDFSGFIEWYFEQMRQEADTARRSPVKQDGAQDKVSIATIHGCKGAEFRAVVLFHVAEGTPSYTQSVATGMRAALEQERRVFHVGLTRATERLLVTTELARPSRFMAELDTPRPEPQPFDPQLFARPVAPVPSITTVPDPSPPSLLGSIPRFLGDLFGVR